MTAPVNPTKTERVLLVLITSLSIIDGLYSQLDLQQPDLH